ncbi:multidrug/biocide efflux PACE transporter [Pseudomonas sp. PS1]|uniref:Multidrug/biocide efflux PACE transporter n=1 Tax=Stutzerimonas marianensis TaxID=2929513 RepID=A0A9X2AUM2_9GAMM|nr:multidrug/biocide efflux PACE transporter [Pseudomonas marianensis]MCJ0973221.1 multidrug/biocide efflux PACE transporter [Pseudomonas marianensis]
MATNNASVTERIIHAVGYELIAVLIFAPALAWGLDKPIESAGALAIVTSIIAMLWNMAFNAIVDRCTTSERINWSITVRLLHGLGFEAGVIAMCVPLAAWMLDITLWQAFLVELGFFAFILPYTVAYNWGFDKISYRFLRTERAIA